MSFCFLLPVFLQVFFSANAAALDSRKSSPRVINEAVQKAVSAHQDFQFGLLLDKFYLEEFLKLFVLFS